MDLEQLAEELMMVLPYWHYKIDRPFNTSHKENGDQMSLETYYCLQMLRWDGAMTMSELAERLRITKQQATQMIDRLYKHDFVRRLYDQEDRRVIRIEITQRAVEYIKSNVTKHTQFLGGLEQKLTREELDSLSGAMETLLYLLPKLD